MWHNCYLSSPSCTQSLNWIFNQQPERQQKNASSLKFASADIVLNKNCYNYPYKQINHEIKEGQKLQSTSRNISKCLLSDFITGDKDGWFPPLTPERIDFHMYLYSTIHHPLFKLTPSFWYNDYLKSMIPNQKVYKFTFLKLTCPTNHKLHSWFRRVPLARECPYL